MVIVQDGWGSAHETTKRFLEMDLGCPSAADISRILEEQRHRVGMEVNKPEGVDGVAVMVPEAVRECGSSPTAITTGRYRSHYRACGYCV